MRRFLASSRPSLYSLSSIFNHHHFKACLTRTVNKHLDLLCRCVCVCRAAAAGSSSPPRMRESSRALPSLCWCAGLSLMLSFSPTHKHKEGIPKDAEQCRSSPEWRYWTLGVLRLTTTCLRGQAPPLSSRRRNIS